MGRALLIAGSRDMAGAAVLAVGGTLRGGAGYAVLCCPEAVATAVNAHYPEAVLKPAGADGPDQAHQLQPVHLPLLLEAAAEADVVCIGPGLGGHEQSCRLTAEFLHELAATRPQIPLLLDADALNHVASARVSLAALGYSAMVLTPHPGEAARLLDWSGAAEVQSQRETAVQQLAVQTGATVVLKGEGTLVAQAEAGPWRNPSGNAGMATAGSGDVLSGLLTALLARGLAPFDAARLAAYLHGRAGDLAVADLGQESLIASDLIRYLPNAILEHSADPS